MPLYRTNSLPDALIRQAPLHTEGAEDRRAVGRLLTPGRPLTTRPVQDGHHPGLRLWAHLSAGADDVEAQGP